MSGAALPLSAFWFLYLAGLGVFFPYFSLYLRENAALSGTQVGLVIAVLPLVGLVSQPFWGQVADRSGSRVRVLAGLALGAALGQAGLFFLRGFPALALGTAALAFFSTAVLPMSVSVSLAALGEGRARAFGRVRVWGTLGFLVLVVGFPALLHRVQAQRGWRGTPGGAEPGLELMFAAAALLFGAAAAVALAIPRGGAVAERAARGDWRALLRHGPVVRLLALTLLAYLFLQGPMGLFAIWVRAHGGDMDTVGRMWVLMLLLEIPLVLWSGVGAERLGARGLLAVGVLSGGVRWTVCGLSDDPTLLLAVQVLHGVTVTGLVIGGPLYIDQAVPERLRSTAQGLYAMVGVGLGGIASNAGSGWLLEHGGPNAPYLAGGLGALALGALLPGLLPQPRRPGQELRPPAARRPCA